MQKKIFRPVKIGAATTILIFTSLLSYSIGLIRDRILSTNFSTTVETDIYQSAFVIPDIIFNLFVNGALIAAFLPIFSQLLTKDKKKAYQTANTMLSWSAIIMIFTSIIAYFLLPTLVSKAYPLYTGADQVMLIQMSRMMLITSIFFAISNTLGNVLMSYKHFTAYSLSPVLYNLGIILGVLIFSPTYGIYSAVIGTLIGSLIHLLIRLTDIRHTPFTIKPNLKFNTPHFKEIVKLGIPKSISLVAWPLNLLIFSTVGATMVDGGYTAFNYARNIQSFSVSLFGIAFATAVFPNLNEAIANKDHQKFTAHTRKTIQRILFFTIPAMVGILCLSTEIITLLLAGGEFQERSITLTATILFFFAVSIPFEALTHILVKVFYSLKNTFTPMIINLLSMIIIAFITFYIAPSLGIQWFSIGFTLAFIFYVALTILLLKKHLQNLDKKSLTTSILKTIIASSVMAAFLILTRQFQGNLFTLIRIALGASTFFITAILLKSSETSSVKYILNRLFKK